MQIKSRNIFFIKTLYETTDSWNSEAQNQRKANRFFKVSLSISLAAFQVGGCADLKTAQLCFI